jgi:hypothetical protein
MLSFFRKIWPRRQTVAALTPAEQPKQSPAPDKSDKSYSADQPISTRKEDRFNRWPFAQRIAETIARRAGS